MTSYNNSFPRLTKQTIQINKNPNACRMFTEHSNIHPEQYLNSYYDCDSTTRVYSVCPQKPSYNDIYRDLEKLFNRQLNLDLPTDVELIMRHCLSIQSSYKFRRPYSNKYSPLDPVPIGGSYNRSDNVQAMITRGNGDNLDIPITMKNILVCNEVLRDVLDIPSFQMQHDIFQEGVNDNDRGLEIVQLSEDTIRGNRVFTNSMSSIHSLAIPTTLPFLQNQNLSPSICYEEFEGKVTPFEVFKVLKKYITRQLTKPHLGGYKTKSSEGYIYGFSRMKQGAVTFSVLNPEFYNHEPIITLDKCAIVNHEPIQTMTKNGYRKIATTNPTCYAAQKLYRSQVNVLYQHLIAQTQFLVQPVLTNIPTQSSTMIVLNSATKDPWYSQLSGLSLYQDNTAVFDSVAKHVVQNGNTSGNANGNNTINPGLKNVTEAEFKKYKVIRPFHTLQERIAIIQIVDLPLSHRVLNLRLFAIEDKADVSVWLTMYKLQHLHARSLNEPMIPFDPRLVTFPIHTTKPIGYPFAPNTVPSNSNQSNSTPSSQSSPSSQSQPNQTPSARRLSNMNESGVYNITNNQTPNNNIPLGPVVNISNIVYDQKAHKNYMIHALPMLFAKPSISLLNDFTIATSDLCVVLGSLYVSYLKHAIEHKILDEQILNESLESIVMKTWIHYMRSIMSYHLDVPNQETEPITARYLYNVQRSLQYGVTKDLALSNLTYNDHITTPSEMDKLQTILTNLNV